MLTSKGDVTGDGKSSGPLGNRAFESLNGDCGGGGLAGDCPRCGDGTPGSFRLLRLRSRELMERPKACSDEPGDSVLLPPEKTDDGILASLSPASLPPYIEARLLTE